MTLLWIRIITLTLPVILTLLTFPPATLIKQITRESRMPRSQNFPPPALLCSIRLIWAAITGIVAMVSPWTRRPGRILPGIPFPAIFPL